MARSLVTIQQAMIDSIAADTTLSASLYSTSKTAIYRLITFVVATAIYLHETLWDSYRSDIENILAEKQTHNLKWYTNKAKSFQYGYALIDDTDTYAVVDDAAKIIAQAAVEEINGVLFLKVAKQSAENLTSLNTSELNVFTNYMQKVKDAGVRINIVTGDGDDLALVMDIFYNPLVLDGDGFLINDSSIEPARETILNYIKSLPFNGEFVPTALVDALQKTEGIDIPVILSCQTKYGTNDFADVDGKVIPQYGYLVVSDLTLNYRANV